MDIETDEAIRYQPKIIHTTPSPDRRWQTRPIGKKAKNTGYSSVSRAGGSIGDRHRPQDHIGGKMILPTQIAQQQHAAAKKKNPIISNDSEVAMNTSILRGEQGNQTVTLCAV